MSKKLSMRDRIAITSRGYGILRRYCPGLTRSKALSSLVSALQPFATIWFSAQIINEISSSRRIEAIVWYVAAVILINFAASLIRNVVDKIYNEKESQMWCWFAKVFADKQMSMDYVDLENAQIQHQRKQAEENLFMFGNGLGQLVWGTAGFVESTVNIIASVSMTVTLFTQQAGNHSINHPLWIIVLLFCILFGGISHSVAVVKENRVFEEWSRVTVWFNRVFYFFGYELYMTPERAKDLRIYEQNHIADRMLKHLMRKDKENDKYIYRMSVFQAVSTVIIGVSNALCYLFVALKALFGAFGVGSIVQYVGALGRLSEGVQGLMFSLSDNEVYCSHLQSLFDFLDIPNQKYQGTLPVEKRAFCDDGDNEYEIEFRDVSFQYPASDAWALRHVSLKLRVGERLAVVGQNGSGKTTFIKLLCRLYDPTEGQILLNGIDIAKYDYDDYMAIFSVVFQDFKLFSFPLGQNVAAGVDYDRSRVEACLNRAGFGDRLKSMPTGIDTCIFKDFDQNGVEISGGEAQKIALARALYKNGPFVVLDEPTAALDPIAEYDIYSRFNELVGSKTAIFISHRLSSCRFCDDIVVFDGGSIVQRGGHGELMAEEAGLYHRLWNAQAQYYQKEEPSGPPPLPHSP